MLPPPDIPTIVQNNSSIASTSSISSSQLPASTERTEQTISHTTSANEKKLRVQILKNEHINRERRADHLHQLQVKFLEEKHEIEMKILKEKLKEAAAKAESAQKQL